MSATVTTGAAQIQRLADIEEIKMLKHRYCAFNDGGWPNHGPSHMGDTAGLFTEDGVWDGRPAAPLSEGREAIRDMICGYRDASPFVVHIVTNPVIEVSGDTAVGSWRVILFSTLADGNSSLGVGQYEDEYVRTADGWKIKRLRFHLIRSAAVDYREHSDLIMAETLVR